MFAADGVAETGDKATEAGVAMPRTNNQVMGPDPAAGPYQVLVVTDDEITLAVDGRIGGSVTALDDKVGL